MPRIVFLFILFSQTGCFQLDVGVQSLTTDSAGSTQDENQNTGGPGTQPPTGSPPATGSPSPSNPGGNSGNQNYFIVDPAPVGAPTSYSFPDLEVSAGAVFVSGGVTFQFDQNVNFGTFYTGSANIQGEPWVVVPPGKSLTIAVASNTPVGVEINPQNPTKQGYHSGAPRFDPTIDSPPSGFSVTGGQIQTVIVAKHFPGGVPINVGTSQYPRYKWVDRQVALTILPNIPPCGGGCALRPAYSGPINTKRLWDLRTFDFSKIVTSRPLPTFLPLPEPIYNEMAQAFNFDYSFNLSYAYQVMGNQNMPFGYAANAAGRRAVLAEYAMNLTTPPEQRLRYQIYLLQYGADIANSMMYGNMSFNEGGGHGHGRAAPFAMFAAASGDNSVKDGARFWLRLRPNREAYMPYTLVDAGGNGFGDISFIYESPNPVAGQPRILWGYVNQFGNVSSDPFGFIDGGHYNISTNDPYSAYYATINSGTATLVNWVEANPAMAELVDPRIAEFAHRYATVGTHTMPDPQAATRPHLAQHHGKRIYDSANIFIQPVCHYLNRHSAPAYSDCP